MHKTIICLLSMLAMWGTAFAQSGVVSSKSYYAGVGVSYLKGFDDEVKILIIDNPRPDTAFYLRNYNPNPYNLDFSISKHRARSFLSYRLGAGWNLKNSFSAYAAIDYYPLGIAKILYIGPGIRYHYRYSFSRIDRAASGGVAVPYAANLRVTENIVSFGLNIAVSYPFGNYRVAIQTAFAQISFLPFIHATVGDSKATTNKRDNEHLKVVSFSPYSSINFTFSKTIR